MTTLLPQPQTSQRSRKGAGSDGRRSEVRDLKRIVRTSTDAVSASARLAARESAAKLLARSIKFGHRRLALMRLDDAVRAGAPISVEQWMYCQRIAFDPAGTGLRELFSQAAYRAGLRDKA